MLTAKSVPVPGPLWGLRPERASGTLRHPLLATALRGPLGVPLGGPLYRRFVQRLSRAAAEASDTQFNSSRATGANFSHNLFHSIRRPPLRRQHLIDALGAAGAAIRRTLGLRVHPTQYFAAIVMLAGGLAEMATGEGKTIAAAIAAAVQAMAGMPVHVITANQYLVERDSEHLAGFFHELQLTVGHIGPEMPAPSRRAAYAQDVVYCTAKELVFDYLRDDLLLRHQRIDLKRRLASLLGAVPAGNQPVMRGLCAAILDEADSVLLDEATVPLIIAGTKGESARRALLWQALAVAKRLAVDRDFKVISTERLVEVTSPGRERIVELTRKLGGSWPRPRYALELVTTALTALHALSRDVDYVVRDGAVCPLDSVTGRVAEGRVWSRGLHGFLELKERCPVSPDAETIARTSFPAFFKRYPHLSGMSGTLREAAGELRRSYGLRVVSVPLRVPGRRVQLKKRAFTTQLSRWKAVADRVHHMKRIGRPVLIGTDSIADSESLAAFLANAGLSCRVLNARQDAEEAAVIADAGRARQVTVATRMAGRGTDIRLAEGVAAVGGLHVINCQANPSPRLDRQLAGRSGRQGEPGSVELLYRCEAVRGEDLAMSATLLTRWCEAVHIPLHWGTWWRSRLQRRRVLRREDARLRRLRRELLQWENEWAAKLTFDNARTWAQSGPISFIP